MDQMPTALPLIVCEDVVRDGTSLSLVGLFGTITPDPGATYPYRHDQFCVFAQFTDGLGEFDLFVELSHSTGVRLWRSNTQRVRFGSPLEVRPVAFRFERCVFHRPGVYFIDLCIPGDVLATRRLTLQPAEGSQ